VSKHAFKLEREMTAVVERWLLQRRGMHVKREFRTPWGYCDLVGVNFRRRNVEHRLKLGQRKAIGPEIRIALLNSIPDCETGSSVTFSALLREFGGYLGNDDLRSQLSYLMAANFVVSGKAERFQKVNGWMPLHKNLVAVELKLSRVEDAFAQAKSNLYFAHESYVGMPHEITDRILGSAKLADFRHAGVGIIGISPRQCTVVLKSRSTRQVDSVLQMHCVERFWREHATNSPS
jgi:hypothetical protein